MKQIQLIESTFGNWDILPILWYTLLSAASIQVLYYLLVYLRIGFYKRPTPTGTVKPVSIVICARNEIKNLKKNLPLLFQQDYPVFEVVVVNDSSFDGTKDFLDEMAQSEPRLKPVHLDIDERYQKGKKFALTIGIKAAENETLLLTDADCYPASPKWIQEMADSYQNKELVLGVSFFRFTYGPINFISRIETFHTAMQYVNFALAKIPYMGVGRNISYTQSLFFNNKGFASHQHLISGDDDLFVNEVATKNNFSLAFHPESQTISESKKGIAAFWKQKTRHFSSSKQYKFGHKFLLFLPSISLLLFWLAAIVLLVQQEMVIETLIIIGIRLLIQWVVIGVNLHRFGKINNIWTVPFWDPIMLFIQFFIGVQGIFSKPKTWN